MIHELKTVQPYFDEVVAGLKKFEYRRNDRDFKKDDILILREYNKESDQYSGNMIKVVVKYVLTGEKFPDLGDYCIMSINDIGHENELEKIKEEYKSILPRLEVFNNIRGYWVSLPFIPQDLGFEHTLFRKEGKPTMDLFHKGGYATSKDRDGLWIVQHGENTFKFSINSKFEAYIIFRALGLELDESLETNAFDNLKDEEE